MTDGRRPAEFLPNRPEITLVKKCQRIERECEKQIQAFYPVQVQLYIFASVMHRQLGYTPASEIVGVSSEGYLVDKDAARAPDLARCILEHRQAADALKIYVSRHAAQIHSIDVSSAKFWPAAPKGESYAD